MLTGVIALDEGSASIFGYRAGSLKAKQVAGVLPEMANAYPDLSGWNNLMFMAELYGVPAGKAREKGAELLQAVGLSSRKDDLVSAYTKGMKQRLISVLTGIFGAIIPISLNSAGMDSLTLLGLRFLLDSSEYLVNYPILYRGLGVHEEVAVGVTSDLLQSLTGVFDQNGANDVLLPQYLPSGDSYI